jgi:hypothetical protein
MVTFHCLLAKDDIICSINHKYREYCKLCSLGKDKYNQIFLDDSNLVDTQHRNTVLKNQEKINYEDRSLPIPPEIEELIWQPTQDLAGFYKKRKLLRILWNSSLAKRIKDGSLTLSELETAV